MFSYVLKEHSLRIKRNFMKSSNDFSYSVGEEFIFIILHLLDLDK